MPGLLTLKTDLKSLKYGQDTPGGGDSGQPYIKTDINTVDRGFTRFRLTKFDDGLIRGGIIGATNASVVDTLRIGKFFTDFPKGPLFLVKQVGLQLSNPRLEHKELNTNRQGTNRPIRGQGARRNIGNFITNTATSVGAFISNTANRIENAVGPTRIYNLGINTLAQVPVNAIGGHILRHGFLPINDESKLYIKVVEENNINGANRLEELLNKLNSGTLDNISQYIGGPGSVYGIGNTIIRKAVTPKDYSLIGGYSSAEAGFPLISGQRQAFTYIDPTSLDGAISSDLGQRSVFGDWNKTHHIGGVAYKGPADKFGAFFDTITDPNELAKGVDQSVYNANYVSPLATNTANRIASYTSAENNLQSGSFFGVSTFSSSKYSIPQDDLKDKSGINNSLDNRIGSVADKNPHSRDPNLPTQSNDSDIVIDGPSNYTGVDNSGLGELSLLNTAYTYTNPLLKTYAELQQKVEKGTSANQRANVSVDRGNLSYTYNTGAKVTFDRTNDTNIADDTLAIKFTPINPFTGTAYETLPFLAYITDYTDTFDSGWGDVKYAGRAEKFYIFNEFKRTVALGFNIPCYNSDQLCKQHDKLRKLASILAGDYKDNLLLGGILTKLKVANYIDNQIGIITSLNFSPIDESSWSISNQLAHYLKVSISFTVIHDFLPKWNKNFITNPCVNDNDIRTTPPTPVKQKSSVIVEETISYKETTFGRQTPESIGFTPNQTTLGPVQTTTTTQPSFITRPQYVNGQPVPSATGNFFVWGPNNTPIEERDSKGNLVKTFSG